MRLIVTLMMSLLVLPGAVLAGKPADHLLGIELGMTEEVARKKLEKIGSPETDLSSLKQSWKLKHKHFGYLAIRYDHNRRVKWVSVFASPNGKKMKYSDVGPLKTAKQTGRYIYTWELPGEADRPGVLITARGSDPKILSGLSISPPLVIREVDVQADLPDTMYLQRP